MSEFIDYLHEVFELFGPTTIRRMLDGYTVYHHSVPVDTIYKETLFLKADAETRRHFESLELPQFTYQKKTRPSVCPTSRHRISY